MAQEAYSGSNDGGGPIMHEDDDGALPRLLQDAEAIGLSEREIVACFSEWLLFDCWRFDGEDFRIFGNFRAVDDIGAVVEEQGAVSFQGRFGDEGRNIALAKLLGALEAKSSAIAHYPLKIDDGPARDFVSIGEYKPLANGSDGLIGIAFEAFQPLRQVSVNEKPVAGAAE